MNITFYNVSDNPKKLEKDISNVIGSARVLEPTAPVEVLNPTVVVNWDNTYGNIIANANYAYIDTFKRYYFISCALDTAQRVVVTGKVDYLMSWAEQIKECPATIVRAQIGHPTYIIDDKYPIDPNRFAIQGIDFYESDVFRSARTTRPYIVVAR